MPRVAGELKKVLKKVAKESYYKTKEYKKRTKGPIDNHMVKKAVAAQSEKKVYTIAGIGELGQVSTNTNKAFVLDVTPKLKNGTLNTERIGNKICLKSMFNRAAVFNTSIQTAPVRFRAQLVQVIGQPYDNTGLMLADFFRPNPYIATLNVGADPIYDYFSPRNEKYFQRFKVLAKKEFRMKGDTVSSQNQQTEVKLGIKNKSINLRYELDSTTVSDTPGDGQIFLVIVTDRGNYTGTCTLAGVIDTAGGTGYAVCFESLSYYTDM